MAKKRISVTLDEGLVEGLDDEADRKDVNRSQLMESIVDGYFKQKGVDTAVVLCGDPELKTLNLRNGKPVLSHILDHLSVEGINRAILLAGQNQEIEENFGSEYSDIALEYIFEDEPRGTASALKQVEERIDGTFVALNGHVIADVDIQDMLRVHKEENSLATVALTAVEDPSNFGVAKLKGRRILGFEEKPDKGEEPSRLINAGTYILDPSVFSELTEPSLEHVFQELAEQGKLHGYIYGGEWKEIES